MSDESAKKEIAIEEDAPAAGKAVEKPRYTLDELLAQCDFGEPLSEEDRTWIDVSSVGMEL
jgi:ribosome assembly protein YihI (activator of Der GTPase)